MPTFKFIDDARYRRTLCTNDLLADKDNTGGPCRICVHPQQMPPVFNCGCTRTQRPAGFPAAMQLRLASALGGEPTPSGRLLTDSGSRVYTPPALINDTTMIPAHGNKTGESSYTMFRNWPTIPTGTTFTLKNLVSYVPQNPRNPATGFGAPSPCLWHGLGDGYLFEYEACHGEVITYNNTPLTYTFTKGATNGVLKTGRWYDSVVLEPAELYRGTVTLDNNDPEAIWLGIWSPWAGPFFGPNPHLTPTQLVGYASFLKTSTPVEWRTKLGTINPAYYNPPYNSIVNNEWQTRYYQNGYYWEVDIQNRTVSLFLRIGGNYVDGLLTKSGVHVPFRAFGSNADYEIAFHTLADVISYQRSYDGSPNPGRLYESHCPNSYWDNLPAPVHAYVMGGARLGFYASAVSQPGPTVRVGATTAMGSYSDSGGLLGIKYGGHYTRLQGGYIAKIAVWTRTSPICTENDEVEFTLTGTHLSSGSTGVNIGPQTFPSSVFLNIGDNGLP